MADMNFDYKKYLEDLTPEQQEKVRECKTKEELMELLAEEDIEIPMDALENVAGGCDTTELYCRSCGSTRIEPDDFYYWICARCCSTDIGRRVVKKE